MTDSIRTILFVEDTPSYTKVVRAYLHQTGLMTDQVNFCWAQTLAEALEQGPLLKPDVAFLDLSLPDSWGLAPVRALRTVIPDTPIIVMIDSDSDDLCEQALAAGAQDYLIKERFTLDVFQRTVRYARIRSRTEAQLHLQTAALAATANSIRITDREGHIEWVNPAFTELTGYSLEEVRGRKLPELFDAGLNPTPLLESLWETLREGKVWRGERIHRRKDGSLYEAELTITPVPDSQGNIDHFIIVEQDITERKCAEERKTSAIFNASPVAMMVCDADAQLCIIDINRAWTQQFGYTRAEIIGRRFLDINLSLSKTDCISRILQVARGVHQPFDMQLLHRDGRILLCHVSAQQVTIEQRRLIIWVMEDVTERRRIEQEIRALNSELEERVAQRTADLARANQELSETLRHLRRTQRELVEAEKLAALGEMVAGIAHELNTPIGNGLMAGSTLKERVREFQNLLQNKMIRRSDLDHFVNQLATAADIITRNLQRAADLVTSFKQVAVDRASSQRRCFDLREMIDEVLLTLHPTLKRTPHQVLVEAQRGLCLDSYPGPLGQTLTNLINNAVLHAFDDGQAGIIRITAHAAGEGRVRIEVGDNGKGIPAELLTRVFNPFVTTKMGQGGTGLGLHVAYNAVTNILGGRLAVRSEEGQGTVFEIWLPERAPQIPGEAPGKSR